MKRKPESFLFAFLGKSTKRDLSIWWTDDGLVGEQPNRHGGLVSEDSSQSISEIYMTTGYSYRGCFRREPQKEVNAELQELCLL